MGADDNHGSDEKGSHFRFKQRQGRHVWSKYLHMVQKDKTITHRPWSGF